LVPLSGEKSLLCLAQVFIADF